MKHYTSHIVLFILTGLMYATSCTSDPDPDVLNSEKGDEISFEVGNSTRAAITTDTTLKDKPFMLFGDLNRTGEFYAGLKTIFNAQRVSFDSKNNRWDYGAKQYWLMGQEHSFIAIHPYEVLEDLKDLEYKDSKLTFTYQIPIENEDMAQDILVAAHRRNYNMDNGGAVRFNFSHILASINIKPALDEFLMYEDETDKENYPYNEDEYILFHRIEMVGVKSKGKFSFTPAELNGANSKDGFVREYDELNDEIVTIVFDYSENPKKVTNNKQNVGLFNNQEAVIVLPQEFGTNSKIILYYTVNDERIDSEANGENDKSNNVKPVRTITIPLSGGKWEVGTNYTYKFTIEKAYTGQIKPGSFTIDVDDPQLTEGASDDAWVWDGETIDFIFK